MKGFSSSNLKHMRFFAEKCPAGLIGQQPADQLPWFHLVTLLTRVTTTLREQQGEAGKLVAATCLPKRRRRQVLATLPARRSGSEAGKERGNPGRKTGDLRRGR
jgi:hypothetical protein